MTRFFISVGSNTEAKDSNVDAAISRLKSSYPEGFIASPLYHTPSASGIGDDYANAVVIIQTNLSSEELNSALKIMEMEFGRKKNNKAEVALDLDIVIQDEKILRSKDFERNHFKIGYDTVISYLNDPRTISIKDFTYNLPESKIALHPLIERDKCKLLIGDAKGTLIEDRFYNLYKYIKPDSLLIYNNTRVINARLRFAKPSGAIIEIFCLEPETPKDYQVNFATTGTVRWKCFVGNSKRWKDGLLVLPITIGNRIVNLTAERIERLDKDSIIEFSWDDNNLSFAEIIEKAGEIPIPPYLNRSTEDSDQTDYQTVYSRIKGSVAAPTAGLHFTNDLLKELENSGIERREVTLHVGAGTFQPVQSETIGEHPMHSEFIVVDRALISELARTNSEVVAVGTTSVRTLESLYHIGCKVKSGVWTGVLEQWYPYEPNHPNYEVKEALSALAELLEKNGEDKLIASTKIIIAPGYNYKIVKRMITNFHQPSSTLLLLVSAMIGDKWREYYDYALSHDFRFLSYGDACLFSKDVISSRKLGRKES